MKAVQVAQYGGPEVLQVREVADPVAGPDDVLIAVKAASVNRLDLFQRDGSRPVPLPFTPGLDAAGVVMQESNGFHAGERVMITRATQAKGGGGYASIIAAPANLLSRIPDGVSFEQAVAAGLAASTAWGSLFDMGQLQQGERVLIWAGSSGVGTTAIQLAKHAGAWVATTSSSEERAAGLRKLGADLVIDYRRQNVVEALQQAGGPVNLVLELVSTTLQTSIDATAKDGRIILVGNLGGQQATIDTQVLRLKHVLVIGASPIITTPANEQRILHLIAEKTLTPIIARTFPVAQAAEAHRFLASGEPQGKVVLTHE
jgi:NADPH:quinone reductase-like Zn-dependent oxidoreductase